jgi:hypothetical protein
MVFSEGPRRVHGVIPAADPPLASAAGCRPAWQPAPPTPCGTRDSAALGRGRTRSAPGRQGRGRLASTRDGLSKAALALACPRPLPCGIGRVLRTCGPVVRRARGLAAGPRCALTCRRMSKVSARGGATFRVLTVGLGRRHRARPARVKPSRACRSSASKRSSTAPTSAPARTPAGTPPPSPSPARPPNGAHGRVRQKVQDGHRRADLREGHARRVLQHRRGHRRRRHLPRQIPQAAHPADLGFWEKYFFKPGDGGYPVFKTRYATIGVYICYDRHFPEGARCLGLNGAEIVFNPSATVAGLSQYLWKLEQPAHAVANGYYVGAINRVGTEAPWNIGKFYGTSYFVNPRGRSSPQGSEDGDELVVADLDLSLIDEVRNTWQFYRDRRPDAYDEIVRQ